MIYFALYREATGRIVCCGKTQARGDITAGRGESVVYSKQRIDPEKHCVKNGVVALKPVKEVLFLSEDEEEAITFKLPEGATVVGDAVVQYGMVVARGRSRVRDRHIKIHHPDYRVPRVTIRRKSGRVS